MDKKTLKELISDCRNRRVDKVINFSGIEEYINESLGRSGWTLLYASIVNNNEEQYKLIEFLLEKGSDPNIPLIDSSKESIMYPIHSMIYEDIQGSEFGGKLTSKGIELLIKYGADINVKSRGYTNIKIDEYNALDLAVITLHEPAEDLLLSLGLKHTDLYYKNEYNNYLKGLNWSCVKNYNRAKRYLERGFDPNKYVSSLWCYEPSVICFATPIQVCVLSEKMETEEAVEMIELLISYGADANLPDQNNRTALDIAIMLNKYGLQEYLINIGAKKASEIEFEPFPDPFIVLRKEEEY